MISSLEKCGQFPNTSNPLTLSTMLGLCPPHSTNSNLQQEVWTVLDTEFIGSHKQVISAFDSTVFIQTEDSYGILKLTEGGPPECIFKRECSFEDHHYFVTTSYVLEFSLEAITSCIPFDFKIRDKERDLPHLTKNAGTTSKWLAT